MIVKVYDVFDVLAKNTVELFLSEVGYTEHYVNRLKRPFDRLIKLDDGVLMRQRIKVNESMEGYLYMLIKDGESLLGDAKIKHIFKLGWLTQKLYIIEPPKGVNNGK